MPARVQLAPETIAALLGGIVDGRTTSDLAAELGLNWYTANWWARRERTGVPWAEPVAPYSCTVCGEAGIGTPRRAIHPACETAWRNAYASGRRRAGIAKPSTPYVETYREEHPDGRARDRLATALPSRHPRAWLARTPRPPRSALLSIYRRALRAGTPVARSISSDECPWLAIFSTCGMAAVRFCASSRGNLAISGIVPLACHRSMSLSNFRHFRVDTCQPGTDTKHVPGRTRPLILPGNHSRSSYHVQHRDYHHVRDRHP